LIIFDAKYLQQLNQVFLTACKSKYVFSLYKTL
jgi:hypothetical protein